MYNMGNTKLFHLNFMGCLLQLQLLVLGLEDGKTIALPGQGSILGSMTKTFKTSQKIYQFLGVPYAESPSGNLRFKPPVARSAWTGVRNATVYGRSCPTIYSVDEDPNSDPEDCLTLDIYTKKLKSQSPVMFYIHGGGFYSGYSAKYKPYYLLEHDVILVVVQYRLGVLGFLSTGTADIPGNMGVLDLILALTWVKKYISYFGGDSNRVTIFGCSAGAALVSGLSISPAVPQGLIHRVIIQSGNILCSWAEKTDSIEIAKGVCQKAGCPDCKNVQNIINCIKSLNLTQLLRAGTGEKLRITDKYSIVSKDYGNIFPAAPHELIEKSRKYPMMIGVVKDEGTFVLAAVYDSLGERFDKCGIEGFIESLLQNIKQEDKSGAIKNMAIKYFLNQEQSNENIWQKLIDFAGLVAIKSPLFKFAQLNVRYSPYPTYLYTFDYRGERSYFGYGRDTSYLPFDGGVHHSNDYMYLLATLNLTKPQDIWMSEIMADLWTSFATNGVPHSNYAPKWKPLHGLGPYLHIKNRSYLGTNFLDELVVNSRAQEIFSYKAVYDHLGGRFDKYGAEGFVESLLQNIKEEDKRGAIKNMAIKYFLNQEQSNENIWDKLIDFAGLVAIKSPLFKFAQLNVRYSPYPTYLYTFDYRGKATSFGYGRDTSHYPFDGGVHHSDDYMYLLATTKLTKTEDILMSEIMSDLWTSFATNGVPHSDYTPKWEDLKVSGTGPYLHIKDRSHVGINFFDEVGQNNIQVDPRAISSTSKRINLVYLMIYLCVLVMNAT